MKTIAELAMQYRLHRSTLSLAVKQGRFPSVRYGKTYVVDEESPAFKRWLARTGPGRPRKSSAAPS